MLGLEEEQVVEISGDNAKYEVINWERNLKIATGALVPDWLKK